MILPISALARSSCNFGKLFLKQQDRAARRLSGPVFLRREIRKNDFSSASSPSPSRIARPLIPSFWLCYFPPTGGKLPKAEPLAKLGALPYCQSLSLWERWHCGAMTERARPLTIKFYPDLTQSWFRAGQPLRDTEPVKSHSSRNLEKLPVFCRNLSLKWQL